MPKKLNLPLPVQGLVVDRPAEFVDSRAAWDIKNIEINRNILRKRLGTSALGSTLGERVQRIFELGVGNATRLFRVGPTKVEVFNKSSLVWASIASAALTGADTDPVDFAFPTLSGVKIATYTNNIDVIRKCTIAGATDAVLGGSPPLCKYLAAFGPYLVLGNVTDGGTNYPSRVQWCDTGAPETWTGGNAGSTNLLEDPDEITGLGVFGNFLTIHKKSAIYLGQLVTTSEVFRFDRRATGVGAVNGATIQNLPSGEQIFLARDGIHLFNGVTAPLIDSPVQDELREEINPLYLEKAQSVYVEELDEYWVCVALGSDTESQDVYKYNWRTRQIYKDKRTNLSAMGAYTNTTEDTWADRTNTWDADTTRWNSSINLSLNPVIACGDTSGVVAKRTAASYDDLDVANEALWETKDFTAADLGDVDFDRLVRWTGLEVWATGSSLKVYYSVDSGVTWILAETLTLSSVYPADSAPSNVYFDVVSSTLRLRFYNNTSEQTFTLKKYQIEANVREARK